MLSEQWSHCVSLLGFNMNQLADSRCCSGCHSIARLVTSAVCPRTHWNPVHFMITANLNQFKQNLQEVMPNNLAPIHCWSLFVQGLGDWHPMYTAITIPIPGRPVFLVIQDVSGRPAITVLPVLVVAVSWSLDIVMSSVDVTCTDKVCRWRTLVVSSTARRCRTTTSLTARCRWLVPSGTTARDSLKRTMKNK